MYLQIPLVFIELRIPVIQIQPFHFIYILHPLNAVKVLINVQGLLTNVLWHFTVNMERNVLTNNTIQLLLIILNGHHQLPSCTDQIYYVLIFLYYPKFLFKLFVIHYNNDININYHFYYFIKWKYKLLTGTASFLMSIY